MVASPHRTQKESFEKLHLLYESAIPHSNVKCTTGFPKDFIRGSKVQALPWTIVQELFDAIDLPLFQLMEVGAFGEKPAD